MAPQTQYARNGKVSIAFEVFGDPAEGQPLLLIMGLDFQMVWWPDAFCERLVACGFGVVRFDNRDTGLSTHFSSTARHNPWRALWGRTKPAYTALDMVDDALAVMDAVGWASANVMGGSMGAALAQAMALVHPERVRSLISCMGLPLDAGPLRTMSYIRFGLFPRLMRIKPGTTRERQIDSLVAIYRAIASPGCPFPEEWARQAATISHDRSPRDPTSTQRQLAAGRAQKFPPLSSITVPTLVIAGRDDPLLKLRGAADTAARIPHARFVSYSGMGHNLPEQLWPEVIDEIRAVTRSRSGPRGA
jgi:pimeloyl-ACP methyl ester carboxylesterase